MLAKVEDKLPRVVGMLTCLFLISGCFSHHKPKDEDSNSNEYTYDCSAAREFVTTYNFLINSDKIKAAPEQARMIAMKVAAGCTGAAKRFVKVALLLTKAKIGSDASVTMATKMALLTDEAVEGFVNIFKTAYLRKMLDMDALSSLQLAQDLSAKIPSARKEAMDDYYVITKFCMTELHIAKPECAQIAARIASYNTNTGIEGDVGDSYIGMIKFLTSKTGPGLTMFDARKISEELVKLSPHSRDNLESAYEFAVSEDGLALDRSQAVAFAKQTARLTIQKNKYKAISETRIPKNK